MFTRLRQLRRADADARIARPEDYLDISQLKISPAVAIEVGELASEYPLAWRAVGDEYELCALTSLAGLGAFHRDQPRPDARIRPLRVEAYPFTLAPSESTQSSMVLVDEVSARSDAPTVPIFAPDGSFEIEAQRRIDAARVFLADLGRTRQFSAALNSAGLLSPWPIRLQLEPETIEINGLFLVTSEPSRDMRLAPLVEEFGYSLIELVTLHSLSLFNMRKLVERHRAARANHAAGTLS